MKPSDIQAAPISSGHNFHILSFIIQWIKGNTWMMASSCKFIFRRVIDIHTIITSTENNNQGMG